MKPAEAGLTQPVVESQLESQRSILLMLSAAHRTKRIWKIARTYKNWRNGSYLILCWGLEN